MTTITAYSFKNKEATIARSETQMDKWRSGLDRLEEEIHHYPSEVQANYRRQIGDLRVIWEQVEHSYKQMESAGEHEWEKSRTDWGKTAAVYWQSFLELANRIIDERHVPLGWVRGLTDERTQESAGWAEGYGRRPSGSEGWTEGYQETS